MSEVAVSFRVAHPDRPALERAIRSALECLTGSWTVSVEEDDATDELGWSVRICEPGRLAVTRVRPEQQTASQLAAIIGTLACGPAGAWRSPH